MCYVHVLRWIISCLIWNFILHVTLMMFQENFPFTWQYNMILSYRQCWTWLVVWVLTHGCEIRYSFPKEVYSSALSTFYHCHCRWLFISFYLNIRRAPHLGMRPNRFTVATLRYYSASKGTLCTLVVFSGLRIGNNIHRSVVLTALFACYMPQWYHVKLLQSRGTFWVAFTIQPWTS